MAETTYESSIKSISSSEEVVFAILSDLSRLEGLQHALPNTDTFKIKDLTFEKDAIGCTLEGLGRVGFRIVTAEPFKTIKFESEHLPFVVNFWIQLKQVAEQITCLKLTLRAELPAMIKMMLNRKLQEGIEKIAEVLSGLPYDRIYQG